MKIYFSPSTGGFYNDDIHQGIPKDAVEVSTNEYSTLMDAQAAGKKIVAGTGGRPKAVDHAPITPNAEEIKIARAAAYKSEADPLFFKAQRGEATMDEWKAKVEEIKVRYPDPVPAA